MTPSGKLWCVLVQAQPSLPCPSTALSSLRPLFLHEMLFEQ